MIEFQHFSTFFNQVGAAALLIIVFWWWYKSENKRIDKMIDSMVTQHKEDNSRIDKMIDMQREDSKMNFKLLSDLQGVLLLQTKGIEQLDYKFDRYLIYNKGRKENESNCNAAKV